MISFKQYLEEKSVSQSQQRLMGAALAYKRGEVTDVPDSVKKVADSMSEKDLEDFAKTKHKGLPDKVED
jgi:hypothetical protein